MNAENLNHPAEKFERGGLKEAYLPEKNIPSTHAKATSLSANEVELHVKNVTIRIWQNKVTHSSCCTHLKLIAMGKSPNYKSKQKVLVTMLHMVWNHTRARHELEEWASYQWTRLVCSAKVMRSVILSYNRLTGKPLEILKQKFCFQKW